MRGINLARLSIPARHRAALSSIQSLSDDSVRQIRAMLDQAQAAMGRAVTKKAGDSMDPDEIVTALQTSGAQVPIKNLTEVLEAVFSLYVVKSRRDISPDQFVSDVCDAMERIEPAQRIERRDRDEYARKLLTLLNANSFAVVTKAIDLATEDERTFCQARILTDLRPVFGENVQDGPKAMVVVHLLKLDFHQQGNARDHGEFYVSLNAAELNELKQVIERAEAKAKSLSPFLKDVSIFGIPRE